jgi:hypothetical protein
VAEDFGHEGDGGFVVFRVVVVVVGIEIDVGIRVWAVGFGVVLQAGVVVAVPGADLGVDSD